MRKSVVIIFIAALIVFASGCNKSKDGTSAVEKAVDSSSNEVNPEAKDAADKTEESKKAPVWIASERIPFEQADLIEEQKTFANFSTVLPFGDKVIVSEESEVFQSASTLSLTEDTVKVKSGSTVYLLNKDANGEWINFVDSEGNSGWIKSGFKQRKYSEGESIIKKLWVKDAYDFACFSPDGKTLVFHRWDNRYSAESGISVCDRATGEEIFTAYAKPHSRVVYAYSPDGKYFYYVENDRTLCMLNIESRETKRLTEFFNSKYDSNESIMSINPLPDGENVLCGLYYAGWKIYNIKKENISYASDNDDFMWANSFAFSPDGKYIAGSATNPADICVWKPDSINGGNKGIVWQKYRDYAGDLYYSADGKKLYVVNGTGITALDALTGKELSKTRIEFPQHMRIEDFEVVPQKDRLVYALNEWPTKSNDWIHSFSYIYVYELSTGSLVQVEHIEDEGKKISRIAVSGDGKYISILVDDGSRVNECHQVVCAIDLNKKPCSLPAVKVNPKEEKYRNFLLDNSFDADGYWQLAFYADGTYTLSARHDGTKTGNYVVKYMESSGNCRLSFSGCGYGDEKESVEFTHKDSSGVEYGSSLPGTYVVNPDYIDFHTSGAIRYSDDYEPAFTSTRPSPSGKTYSYHMHPYSDEDVVKYPMWGEKDIKYLYVQENTKMRSNPFLDAEPVWMPYNDYSDGGYKYVEKRCIVQAGRKFRIIGATVRKDTVDGKTAPWYLIYEDDGGDMPSGQLVWVFGGYSMEVDEHFFDR
ncbi:MAG: PD40 domain-containing protein [Treponema sp.]|nr:PD40 domain-containing protein [Treponema sp.]